MLIDSHAHLYWEDFQADLPEVVQLFKAQTAYNLQPFMPQTADKILNQFSGPIKSGQPLFPRST